MQNLKYLVAGVLIASPVSAEVLQWDAPTTRVDGSAITADELASYEVWHNGASKGVVPAPTTEFDLGELAVGKHVLEVSVADTDGNKSDKAELQYTKKAKPTAPGKLKVKRLIIELGE